MDLKTIGEEVKNARRQLGLTQVQLADLAGVSYRPVVQIESGRPIRLDTLLSLCGALGLDLQLTAGGKVGL